MMDFSSSAGTGRMESDTVTVEGCWASANHACVLFGSPASVDSILITNTSEWLDYRASSAIAGDASHKSLINSVPSVVLDADLAGFISNRQLGGMHNNFMVMMSADVSSRSDLFLGAIEAKGEIASRVAGGPVAVQSV